MASPSYSRGRAGSSLKEFKSVGTIPAPSQAIENLLASVADYPRFMPYVTESRLISQSGNITVSYHLLTVPFVSNRDYTVRVEHGTETTPAGTIFRDSWQAANEAGPAERHGIVRVKINEGSWLLEPVGPNATRATYRIYTDSGGTLPAFLANRASQTVIPKVFAAIRKQAQDPKYAAASGPAASAKP